MPSFISQSARFLTLPHVLAASALWTFLLPAARGAAPDDPGPADVHFTVSTAGSKPISPYIYGMNFFANSSLTNPVTLDRLGGNRWSAYNWETNASNAGKDYRYQNDNYLVNGQSNTPPGAAVLGSLQAAAANNRALIVTVPTAGYASADATGQLMQRSDFAPSARFKTVVAKKAAHYPGVPLSLTPDEEDDYVFTDEFVNWVESTRQPNQQVFYSLDNEPGLWGESLPANFSSNNWNQPAQPGRTHPEIHPSAPTFGELKKKTIAHASAIKDVNPDAVVFGGVGYGWNEFTTLQDAPDRTTSPAHAGGDQTGELHYYEWLLQQVAAEEAAQGRTLLDVLDLHWYPEAQGGGVRIVSNDNSAAVVEARLQAPRSLWDPTYTETSWISQWSTWVGSPGTPGPVRLLPRVQRDIDEFKPGTKIAITEYNYGGTNHISGGIAQADALGVFGQSGVYAANFWSLYGDGNSQFVSGAFKMYLDYDGAAGDGKFGDMSIDAATDAIAQSAVYASLDSTDPGRMVFVAINRTGEVRRAAVAVTAEGRFDVAEVYQLTGASASPMRVADIPIELVNAFLYDMPPYSVSTLVLRSGDDGDFDLNGQVDAADLGLWAANFGLASGARFTDGDNDRDGDVDGADFLAWQRAQAASPNGQIAAPEPSALALATVGLCCAVLQRAPAGRPAAR
jgi:hypothetical protein